MKLNHLLSTFLKESQKISPSIPSINLAVTILNSKRNEIQDSAAISCINKLTNYLNWFKTIGAGGNDSYQGKQETKPTNSELFALAKTKLFDKDFISSLALIIGNHSILSQLDNIYK